MSNYYIDTEFIEGFKKPIKWLPTIGKFNKPQWSIQLISIGIVAEDGREYYAISNEFNPRDASDWVKENVLKQLPDKVFTGNNRHETKLWKSNKQIAHDIFMFVHDPIIKEYDDKINFGEEIVELAYKNGAQPHRFYGYYADYEWVLLCTLFGTMMHLPKGFPMYCIDLKQLLDEKAQVYEDHFMNGNESFETRLSYIKNKDHYPKQTNEHNALSDAHWNKQLHDFIKTLK